MNSSNFTPIVIVFSLAKTGEEDKVNYPSNKKIQNGVSVGIP
jgi:hypothetical protein